jgi:hypothetical protein
MLLSCGVTQISGNLFKTVRSSVYATIIMLRKPSFTELIIFLDGSQWPSPEQSTFLPMRCMGLSVQGCNCHPALTPCRVYCLQFTDGISVHISCTILVIEYLS